MTPELSDFHSFSFFCFSPPSLQGPVVSGLHIYQPPLLSCELNLCNVNPWRGPGEPAEVDSPCPCPS